ncbi:pentapeptide repeat-containing protein [Dolichospermum sp. UHCC 0259]|uniref:pentapeptide repeat-containing protein n=1 Tax=Dolichospermum sp. UHCC 0259 TaxID=2590010 RepID=UPI001445FF90|nr:pentapeptide repeat-containing protein [Dolichospermum sp. UHCC 0259]MTJ47981.1 NACHT domain-containing protein [Dolichospermum sp. UHCC 0259]
MKKSLLNIWYQFRQAFSVTAESTNTTTATGEVVLEAATAIQAQDSNLEVLQLLVQNSSSLLDVLCSPLTQIITGELSFLSLGVTFLKSYRDLSQETPTLADYISIISQVAYLESIRDILSLYPSLNYDHPDQNEELGKILATINNLELDEQTAIQTIECFHESELAVAFNQLLSTRLTSDYLGKYPARLLAKRIAVNTNSHIIKFLLDLDDDIIPNCRDKWAAEQENIQNIQEYLKHHIDTQALDQVFDQTCTFKEIYIPLKAKSVNQYGQININAESCDLEAWVKKNILTENNSEKLIFIQGKRGRGKSVFCKIFANWIRQHLHPFWTPILINVKDIKVLSSQLAETLTANLDISLIRGDHNWLRNKNHRFVFIFDGWDELPTASRNNQNLEKFIQQISEFQQQCQNDPSMGHKVLITSNVIPLSIISNLPTNLERVEILPLDQQQQEKWLEKWRSLPNNHEKNTDLQQFLVNQKCPAIIQKLISEPLLLYFLAGMYRDDQLVIDNLAADNTRTATALIYQAAINWLISKSGETFHDQLPNLKDILTEAAVAVTQSGEEFSAISMLKSRLGDDAQSIKDDIIKTPLANFYVYPDHESDNQVNFSHQSFREFLFADSLKLSLTAWTQYYNTESAKELITNETEMNWQIYDLLGFGILSKEIVEYLMGLMIAIPNFRWVQLYRRLDDFYVNWCQGKFVDTAEETLPQTKLRELQNAGIYQLGQRQVDIYAGLNVMILLLAIQRYAQEDELLKEHIIFYPSGQPEDNNFTYQLQNIIYYSSCLQGENFRSLVGQFLSGAHLRGASLLQINLSYADLTEADLSRASLCGANFSYANLNRAYFIGSDLRDVDFSGANLAETYLSGANLSRANLCGANLQDVDLSRANLSGADLRGANFDGANFMGAIFSDHTFGDIRWDEKTNWQNAEGLEMAKNVPLTLKKRFLKDF